MRAILYKIKTFLLGGSAHIVEKYASNTTSFMAMWNMKVGIAPLLEVVVISNIVSVAGVFVHLMEMNCILFKQVGWCEICTSTKPPASLRFTISTLKIAIICVNGRSHWIVWMKH